eukprot:g15252.t1
MDKEKGRDKAKSRICVNKNKSSPKMYGDMSFDELLGPSLQGLAPNVTDMVLAEDALDPEDEDDMDPRWGIDLDDEARMIDAAAEGVGMAEDVDKEMSIEAIEDFLKKYKKKWFEGDMSKADREAILKCARHIVLPRWDVRAVQKNTRAILQKYLEMENGNLPFKKVKYMSHFLKNIGLVRIYARHAEPILATFVQLQEECVTTCVSAQVEKGISMLGYLCASARKQDTFLPEEEQVVPLHSRPCTEVRKLFTTLWARLMPLRLKKTTNIDQLYKLCLECKHQWNALLLTPPNSKAASSENFQSSSCLLGNFLVAIVGEQIANPEAANKLGELLAETEQGQTPFFNRDVHRVLQPLLGLFTLNKESGPRDAFMRMVNAFVLVFLAGRGYSAFFDVALQLMSHHFDNETMRLKQELMRRVSSFKKNQNGQPPRTKFSTVVDDAKTDVLDEKTAAVDEKTDVDFLEQVPLWNLQLPLVLNGESFQTTSHPAFIERRLDFNRPFLQGDVNCIVPKEFQSTFGPHIIFDTRTAKSKLPVWFLINVDQDCLYTSEYEEDVQPFYDKMKKNQQEQYEAFIKAESKAQHEATQAKKEEVEKTAAALRERIEKGVSGDAAAVPLLPSLVASSSSTDMDKTTDNSEVERMQREVQKKVSQLFPRRSPPPQQANSSSSAGTIELALSTPDYHPTSRLLKTPAKIQAGLKVKDSDGIPYFLPASSAMHLRDGILYNSEMVLSYSDAIRLLIGSGSGVGSKITCRSYVSERTCVQLSEFLLSLDELLWWKVEHDGDAGFRAAANSLATCGGFLLSFPNELRCPSFPDLSRYGVMLLGMRRQSMTDDPVLQGRLTTFFCKELYGTPFLRPFAVLGSLFQAMEPETKSEALFEKSTTGPFHGYLSRKKIDPQQPSVRSAILYLSDLTRINLMDIHSNLPRAAMAKPPKKGGSGPKSKAPGAKAKAAALAEQKAGAQTVPYEDGYLLRLAAVQNRGQVVLALNTALNQCTSYKDFRLPAFIQDAERQYQILKTKMTHEDTKDRHESWMHELQEIDTAVDQYFAVVWTWLLRDHLSGWVDKYGGAVLDVEMQTQTRDAIKNIDGLPQLSDLDRCVPTTFMTLLYQTCRVDEQEYHHSRRVAATATGSGGSATATGTGSAAAAASSSSSSTTQTGNSFIDRLRKVVNKGKGKEKGGASKGKGASSLAGFSLLDA